MAKTSILVFLILICTAGNLQGQHFEKPTTYEIPQQSVYLELGGNGLVYSLNYDVLFKNGLGIRLGGAYLTESMSDATGDINGPYKRIGSSNAMFGLVMGQKMFGKGSSKAEFGAGILFGTIYDPDSWDYIKPPGITFSAGYRLYPSDSGKFTFKAAFTPIITGERIHPGFGISFGYTLTPEGNFR